MFTNREKKELRKQNQEKVKDLNQTLKKLSADYNSKIEEYTRSMSTKWEYAQFSTKDANLFQKIRELGRAGWEMVGATSFTEGSTLGVTSNYTVHTLYVFKRQLPKFPQEFTEKYNVILDIRRQISNLESQ